MKKKNGERRYRRNDMRGEEWKKIKDYIKEKKGRAGKDDRNFLNGVFWILRTGAPWRDLPPDYGKWVQFIKDLFDGNEKDVEEII